MSSRAFAILIAVVCAGSAATIGTFDVRVLGSTSDPPMPLVQSPEPPSPTVTPLPPPPVPPPDAAGISATTPPIGSVVPLPRPTVPTTLWLAAGTDTSTVQIAIHGNRLFVPVVANGVRRDFLLSSLHPSAIDQSLPVDGTAGSYYLRTLQIGDVRLTNVRVSRERLLPFSQSYLGSPAAGIIGADLFERYPVTIDYPNRTMTIYRSTFAAEMGRAVAAMVTPMEMVKGAPAVSCIVDQTKATPCFVDVYSDADLSLWSPSFGIKNDVAISMRDADASGEMRGLVYRARRLTIGTLAIDGPLVNLWGGEDESVGAPLARAALGSGVLSRFTITIDEPGGALIMLGDPVAASQPTPFDGSGAWLVWRNNAIVIRSIVRKSPADAAGLTSGDVILAIDGKPATDLDSARLALMRPSGVRTTLTVQRGAVRRDVTFTLRTLI